MNPKCIGAGSASALVARATVDAADPTPKEAVTRITSISSAQSSRRDVNIGNPQAQMEVEEAVVSSDNTTWPPGPKVWLTYVTLCLASFLHGLDLAIVAVAAPRLTDHFKTIADIGWYSAAYGLVASSFIFFFGKCYTVFRPKQVYMSGLIVFELGSILCTFAPTSKAFIIGRAVAGLGASAFTGGYSKLLKDMFPTSKLALVGGISGSCSAVGLVSAPIVGGLLIDKFSWRACFGINFPLMILVIAFTYWAFEDPSQDSNYGLSIKEKLLKLDILGTCFIVPAITCLLLGLQWGGIKYGWGNARIISLFVIFIFLLSGFVYIQYRKGEDATIPPRIMKNRSILGALWFCSCCNGILATTEYYMSIYFQGVRGISPSKAGLFGVPMLVGLLIASLASASATTIIGYYYRESMLTRAKASNAAAAFLFATSILSPIASGLLTTVDLDNSMVKPIALLAFLGIAVGFGIQGPALACQVTLSSKDVSIGSAFVGFGGGLGSALWICVSTTLFQSRLSREISVHSPNSNVTAIERMGLSEIRSAIGGNTLKNVLTGYNEAVVQTLYLPLTLCILTLAGTLLIERKSIKKKAE